MSITTPFTLARDAFGRLALIDVDGNRHEDIAPVRAFPIGAPDDGIALVNAEGHELVWIDQLDDLPEKLAEQIREELASREFVPEILSIIGVSSYACPSTWDIESDRGRTSLTLKGEEDIRRLGQDRLLIADTHGIQYLIRKLPDMDRQSRRILDRFL